MHHHLVRFAVSVLIAAGLAPVWVDSALASQSRSQQQNGTLLVDRELCGGVNVGAKHCGIITGKWTGCDGDVCSSLNEVVVRTPRGREVATVGVRRGRFVVRLKPGTYVVSLLWTSKHHRPTVALKRRVAVRAGRTTTIVFKGYAG